MRIDPEGMATADLYRLLISVVVPRPIAWVSTISAAGVANAAPFSYFQAVSSKPPTIMIAVGRRRDGAPKDTRRNIEESGSFVVNLVAEDALAAMVATAVDYPPETSEFAAVGLTPIASERVTAPRIADSAVAMECRLERVLEIGNTGLLFGEVVLFHVADRVVAVDGTADCVTVDPAALRMVARLGGSEYWTGGTIVSARADAPAQTRVDPLLDLWRELRARTLAMLAALTPDHLARSHGAAGSTVGRLFRHMAAVTHYRVLELAGRTDEDEMRAWDATWTPERLAAELTADRDAFVAAMRGALPAIRPKLERMIRHEAWHQGQIAAVLRADFPADALWYV